MLPQYQHPDHDVHSAFRKLSDALCQWERATGRCSLLIFRESEGNPMEHGPMPSAVQIRLDNGVKIDPSNADVSDDYLLKRFTDTSQ